MYSHKGVKTETRPSIGSSRQISYRSSDLTFHDKNLALHAHNLFSSVVFNKQIFNPFKGSKRNLNSHEVYKRMTKVLIFTIPFLGVEELITIQKAFIEYNKSKQTKAQIDKLIYHVNGLLMLRDFLLLQETFIGGIMLTLKPIW